MRKWGITCIAVLALLSPYRNAEAQEALYYDIGEQPVGAALNVLGLKSGIEVFIPAWRMPRGIMSRPVRGTYTFEAALKLMLEGTGLLYEFTNERTVTVRPQNDPPPPPTGIDPAVLPEGMGNGNAQADVWGTEARGSPAIPEVLVLGMGTLNIDPRRSQDGVQPYVIFDRETIRSSGEANIGDFLAKRLPQAYGGAVTPQGNLAGGGTNVIDLRGLGSSQTLILIDGRRFSGSNAAGQTIQPDLNGIPIAAIERIEVLPDTASGIYGGGATGGVINIILRRDYEGTELQLQLGNPIDNVSGDQQLQLSHGLGILGGRVRVLLTGMFYRQKALSDRERPFQEDGRQKILRNNPSYESELAVPPIGATPNIRSGDGSALFGPDTPSFTYVPPGYTRAMGIEALAKNAGHYNWNAADTAQAAGGGEYSLLNDEYRRAGEITIFRDFSKESKAYLRLTGSNSRSRALRNFWDYGTSITTLVPATAPTNPFGQDILVSVPAIGGDLELVSTRKTEEASSGYSFGLPAGWMGATDATFRQSRLKLGGPESRDVSTQVDSGALDLIRDPALSPFDTNEFLRTWTTIPAFRTTTLETRLLVGGPINSSASHPVTLSAQVEYRTEEFEGGSVWRDDGPGTGFVLSTQRGEQSLSVASAYGELFAPLIPDGSGWAGLRMLDLQFAARFDSYKTAIDLTPAESAELGLGSSSRGSFNSWSQTLGIRFKPIQDLLLRASYATGFQPPPMSELRPGRGRDFTAAELPGLSSGGGPAQTIRIYAGGNPSLRPERSYSTSMGFVYEPRWLKDVRLSVDGVRIVKRDNFYSLSNDVFDDFPKFEQTFPDRVERDALGRIRAVNATTINAAQMKVTSVDLDIQYRREVPRVGLVRITSKATLVTDFKMQPTPLSPLREYVGVTSRRPLERSATFSAGLTRGQWSSGWDTRYYGPYIVSEDPWIIQNQGARKIRSQTYHDAYVSWRSTAEEESVRAIEIRLGLRNVFNTKPRFDAEAGENSYFSLLGDPRMAAYYISIRGSF
jgi:iron complex outermembrane recepter protein